ncbi:Uncharacterised protein [Vibrio cholerae]|nr:Uncharacterised protein [Vibrio cholerae]
MVRAHSRCRLQPRKQKRTWGDCLLSTQKAVPRPDPRRQPKRDLLVLGWLERTDHGAHARSSRPFHEREHGQQSV